MELRTWSIVVYGSPTVYMNRFSLPHLHKQMHMYFFLIEVLLKESVIRNHLKCLLYQTLHLQAVFFFLHFPHLGWAPVLCGQSSAHAWDFPPSSLLIHAWCLRTFWSIGSSKCSTKADICIPLYKTTSISACKSAFINNVFLKTSLIFMTKPQICTAEIITCH